ncbi:Alanyl-tRNA synthetase [Fusarium albosuccineum]|uniref:Alanyl-tRNA synthetase n=1 Tax=Fusarium albosuccineum TaxID=1237068 RepID=A0A8H4LEA9_9HYPO|nr:Alanyl-tRNA synthetase [Fusarium albosuccineum]
MDFGPTNAIYLTEEGRHVCNASILASIPLATADDAVKELFRNVPDADHLVATDSTIFYPKGGGQPSDTGTMTSHSPTSEFRVKAVHKLPSGTILHLGSYSGQPFACQDTVVQTVDSQTRRLHSRIHDAGHIIASAVRSLGVPDIQELKAQHYPGIAFVDFKGVIPSNKKGEIERVANTIVEDDRAIMVQWWTSKQFQDKSWTTPDELDDEDDQVRAVEIEGVGAYMCGGTHVGSTGLVGEIRVRKIKKQQHITRVSYELVE